jgi:hypothetical protein
MVMDFRLHNEQYRCENLADKGKGTEWSHIVDGNILEVNLLSIWKLHED